MVRRTLSIFAVISCVSLLGCSSPGGSTEAVGEAQGQAVSLCSDCVTGDLTDAVDDTNAPMLLLSPGGFTTSFNELTGGTTGTLVGTINGVATSITVTNGTRVKHIPLGLWPPDPVYPIAQNWNSAVQNGPQPATFVFSSLSEDMLAFANTGKRVRLKLDSTGTFALSLRPLP